MAQKELRVSGAKGYLVWLAQNQPIIYSNIREKLRRQLPQNLSGFGVVDASLLNFGVPESIASDPIINSAPTGASSAWADALKNILNAGAVIYTTKTQIDAQKKLNDMQLERIRQGLPPLNIDPAALGLATASASVGLTPNTQKFLMWGGVAVIGAWVFSSMFGGRRRAA